MISKTFNFGSVFGIVMILVITAGCNSMQNNDKANPESPPPPKEVKSQKIESVEKTKVLSYEKASRQPFAPTFTPPQAAFDYAQTIYKSSKGKPTGVYVCHGVVFVIVNIDLRKEKLRYVKGTAMLRSKALLEKKYKLPMKYQLPSRLLEDRNYTKFKHYRYALAYREKDILALAEK